jgi:hypothetical protein
MNLLFDISQININNIIFSDSKKNIIMDGNFTKIIYSDTIISTNGLYIKFPIKISSVDINSNKYIVKFNILDLTNSDIIQSLVQLETQVLEYYKTFYHCNKLLSTILHDQLNYGNIKLQQHTIHDQSNNIFTSSICNRPTQLFLKISGIWESEGSIGLTYKIMESV